MGRKLLIKQTFKKNQSHTYQKLSMAFLLSTTLFRSGYLFPATIT